MFIDGELVSFEEYIVDAGRGCEWADWVDLRAQEIATASDAVGALVYERALDPSGGKYIEEKPDDPQQCIREFDELIADYRAHKAEENR